MGLRDRGAARQLGSSLPGVYRQCAAVYTDFWEAYETVIPQRRHRAVGKEMGKTSYIERFNCTLRQRVSRLVRKALSFLLGKEVLVKTVRKEDAFLISRTKVFPIPNAF